MGRQSVRPIASETRIRSSLCPGVTGCHHLCRRLAKRRSVGLHACLARRPRVTSGPPARSSSTNTTTCFRIRRFARRRTRCTSAPATRCRQQAGRRDAIERVEEGPLMCQGTPSGFDHRVGELQLREGQETAEDARVDQFVDLGVHVRTPASANTTGYSSSTSARSASEQHGHEGVTR